MEASSSSPPRWNYDVFLSFRGEDTRKNFVHHLYVALQQKEKSISSQLLKAIKESKFAIIVFSENYATSSSCLDELVEIILCKNTIGLTVLPVFYDVDPSQVRKQKGSFGEAFVKHEETFREDKEKVQRWRAALTEAANLSGWDINNIANGHEVKFIQKIVQEIIKQLGPIPLNVARYQVGIDSRVNKVFTLLDNGLNDVCIVGICGAGGIGKTTISKVVFNRIYNQFESCCFLSNVKEVSEQHGLTYLQQLLLNDILTEENLKIRNVDFGINMMKKRLRYKKVLVVLDDVDSLKQLESLVGGNDWFGSGSRIIVTTRNERLLVEHKVDHEMFRVELLNDDEALELFSWYAFTNNHPLEDYVELSRHVIKYAQGLPLALQVLGSFLFKRSLNEWEHEVDNWKKIPNREIYDVLKISFDGLNDTEKDLFLDIACFFKGYDKDYVMDILGSNGFHPRIPVLIERSLITISYNNKLCMHDLIQEMGKEIVRQESPDDPGKCSRLWFHEDIFKVLRENTVTETIKGIMLNMPRCHLPEELYVNVDVFEKMKKLKLLKLSGITPCGHLTYLSNELCYLDWDDYSTRILPSNFHPKNLVHLSLCHNNIKEISSGIKFLEKLKFIDLSHSLYLDKTPDLSNIPCLENLILKGCTKLTEVHQSIGVHERLVKLDLSKCKNLRSLPGSIKLKNLRSFSLSGCSKLEKFPNVQGCMDCLLYLYLDNTAIKDFPSSIGHLERLQILSLENCRKLKCVPSDIFLKMKGLRTLYMGGTAIEQLPSSIAQLSKLSNLYLNNSQKSSPKTTKSLIPFSLVRKRTLPSTYLQLELLPSLSTLLRLVLRSSNLSEESFPRDIGSLSCLKELDLSDNKFSSIPASLIQLKKLKRLDLVHCTSLRTLTSLPSSICYVDAHGCKSLERYWIPPSGSGSNNREFIFTECHKLVMDQMDNMPNISSQSQLQGLYCVIFPESEIPQWFSHKSEVEGCSSASLVVDQHHLSSYNNVKGIFICAALEFHGFHSWIQFDLKINGYGVSRRYRNYSKEGKHDLLSDHVILRNITEYYDGLSKDHQPIKNLMKKRPKLSPGPLNICDNSCHIEVSLKCLGPKVKKLGVHLVMEDQAEGQ
ncbi:disease resistance protein RUN1-like isoform X2 [Cornus florida]|uniref:disease resistance protein RUN1-like isoform X2 n=1 Tax=Cornus florida TaxID=4283 RepID=UPI0028A295A5|nr:disease resistance protein RUN1-like isoform X2 [Cornus florida]XP_059665562.1 disease resistance protein RUN1-like isoform X2 [Cornus florida]